MCPLEKGVRGIETGHQMPGRESHAEMARAAARSPREDQALSLVFYWDSVPNPDAPRGLFVLHVFAAANTRTRSVV